MFNIIEDMKKLKDTKQEEDGPSSELFRREFGTYFELENLFKSKKLTQWQMTTIDRVFNAYIKTEEFGDPKDLMEENIILKAKLEFLKNQLLDLI